MVAIAVVLSMVMIPAVPGVTLAQPAVAGVEVVPNVTYVSCPQNFDLEIWARVPPAQAWDTGDVHLDFGNTCFVVNSIANGALPTVLGSAFSNATGTIDFTAGILGGTVTGDQLICTVNCTATCNTGISPVNFVNIGPLRVTDVINGGMSLMNWTLVVNGTVFCGTPTLNVDVLPAGKGSVSGFGPYPDSSSQSWWAVIALDAQDTTLGWTFDFWSGDIDLAAATNPNQVTMSALARNVTANFKELPNDLDVDPNSIICSARMGPNEGNATVTVKNDGGGTMCWQVGYPVIWTPGDSWTYYNTYDEAPPGSPFPNPLYNPLLPCPVTNTTLSLTVTGETPTSYLAFADWPMADPQRADSAGAPICMQDAAVVVHKCSLDYDQQLANLTIYMGPPPGLAAQVLVSWAYDGCHGWPYYVGKTWNYNMTIVKPAPLPTVVVPAHAMVTSGPVPSPVGGPETDCYVITHYLVSPASPFMQQYWSDTAKNFVYQWDGGTFLAPPLDQRILLGGGTAPTAPPACCTASCACNISFDKVGGSLTAGASEVLTVLCNVSGLAVGSYNGSFCISTCNLTGVQHECVDVTCVVLPATTVDAPRDLPLDRLDYDAEYPGMTFKVYVNFTAPVDNFNSIGLTDFAPAGWEVETNTAWCVPVADWTMHPANKAEYAWAGPFLSGQVISARYNVTIPATAVPGSNFWPTGDPPECNCTPGTCPPCEGSPQNLYAAWIEYWFANEGPFESCIIGECEKVVTVPGCVVGETRDVVGNVLDTVMVNLWEDDLPLSNVTGDVWEDADSSSLVPCPVPSNPPCPPCVCNNWTIAMYEDCADDTGMYYLRASKYCYNPINTRPQADGGYIPPTRNPAYPDYINWSTPELLAAGANLCFVGDYGLVCKAASMSYAMEAVNHMLFVPLGEDGVTLMPCWQLSSWKAMEVVHSWQFPCGCACGG